MKKCFSCGHELDIPEKPGRRDACPHCGADLRVCRNCRFYDEKACNESREPVAERVVEKEKGNFCDYFEFGGGAAGKSADTAAEAKKKLDDLFNL